MSDRIELARMAFLQLNGKERREFLRTFSDPAATASAAPEPDRIVRRGEVARLLARSQRFVDRLAHDGTLARVKLPGRHRGAGFRLSAVQSLIAGGTA